MRLNIREKIFIVIGAVILVVMAVYFIVVEPLAEHRDRLKAMTARMQTELAEMQTLAARYKVMAANRELLEKQIKARGSNFSPFSYLENAAKETGLTGQIESMTPVVASSEEGRAKLALFDLRLAGVKLRELVRFIYKLQSGEEIFFVENLNIRPRYLTPELLDVTMRLASPKAT